MNKRARVVLMLLILLSGFMVQAEASIPHLINYQGRITDSSGNPLTGSYDITFRIYDAEAAGVLLWQETHTGLVVDKGLFNVLLGSVSSLDLVFDKAYFLEIKVGEEVMSPRQRITSSGYAFRAETAENATALDGYTVSATPAPNKILPMSDSGKLPVAALKVYDSGWFQIAKGQEYTLTHNFGLSDPQRMVYTVYIAQDASGTGSRAVSPATGFVASTSYGVSLQLFSANSAIVQVGNSGLGALDDNGTMFGDSGTNFDYCRVVAIALEG